MSKCYLEIPRQGGRALLLDSVIDHTFKTGRKVDFSKLKFRVDLKDKANSPDVDEDDEFLDFDPVEHDRITQIIAQEKIAIQAYLDDEITEAQMVARLRPQKISFTKEPSNFKRRR